MFAKFIFTFIFKREKLLQIKIESHRNYSKKSLSTRMQLRIYCFVISFNNKHNENTISFHLAWPKISAKLNFPVIFFTLGGLDTISMNFQFSLQWSCFFFILLLIFEFKCVRCSLKNIVIYLFWLKKERTINKINSINTII